MKFTDSEMMERYLRGESNAEERHKVLMWLMINLKSSSADDEFSELLDKVPQTENPLRKQRVRARLDGLLSRDRREEMREKRRRRTSIFFAAALSAVCCVIAVLAYENMEMQRDINRIVSWTEVTATYGERKEVVLPDGSHIWLHNDSRMTYPDGFHGGLRQVFVSGEIYADIVKDEECPFVVSADSANVVVTGTRFNFRSYPDMGNVEVTLVEGSVELDCLTSVGRQSLAMVPGETVSVDLGSGSVSKHLTDASGYVSWKDRRALYFNDMTLEHIVGELQREFDVKIIIRDKALARTRHYASFINDETPIEILKALCSESGINVSQKDSIIYIYNN